MRVLVTNTHTPQAYAVVRALRPHAERLVAAIEGDGLGARLAHAAHSRLVDATVRLPSPVGEWWQGRIGPENSPVEQRYIEALERVVERERIDVIFPSWDPYVYVLSKNLSRLARAGVTVPVPDFDTMLTALDKYRTVQAGQAVGFPCPGTILHASASSADEATARFGFPLVVKPRFTSGGRGMHIVRDRAELESVLPEVVAQHGHPMLQEYIPGGRRDSVQFVLNRQGEVVFVFHKRRQRTLRRTARLGTVSESAAPDARLVQSSALLERVGWWGAMGIETMHDPRDGQQKLMEINPRFPRQLWNRTELGINEPLWCVQIARGEQIGPAAPCPVGVRFVSPVEDIQLLFLQLVDAGVYAVRTHLLRRPPLDPSAAPVGAGSLTREFIGTYTSRMPRVWDPYFRHFFQDPVAALLWWLQFAGWIAGSLRYVGR